MLVAGEVDHPGQLFRAALAGVDVMPDVLVDAEGGDVLEPGLVGRELDELGFDGPPHRLPRRAELTGQPRNLLRERLPHTVPVVAPPDPLPPHDPHPGTSCSTRRRRPRPVATTPHDGHPAGEGGLETVTTKSPSRR